MHLSNIALTSSRALLASLQAASTRPPLVGDQAQDRFSEWQDAGPPPLVTVVQSPFVAGGLAAHQPPLAAVHDLLGEAAAAAKISVGTGGTAGKSPKQQPAPAPAPAPPAPSPTPVPVAPSSGTYAFEGPRWASRTITWSFATSTYAQDAATPFSSAIGTAYQSTVQQALQRWASVSGLSFVQQADSTDPSKAANIRIGFADLNTPTSYVVGYTNYHYTTTSTGSSTFSPDTVVRLEDPSKNPLAAGAGGSFTYQGFTTTLYQTVLHELGHALGLGHSTDAGAIMYPTLGTADPDLNANDIAGIQALYGAAPAGTTSTALAATSAPATAAAAPSSPKPPVAASTLVFRVSEDTPWQGGGDAQCCISIDGRQLGGVQTIKASHALGQSEEMKFLVELGAGPHTASVQLIHAASSGQGEGEDRPLYIDAIEFNGEHLAPSTAMLLRHSSNSSSSTGAVAHFDLGPSGQQATGFVSRTDGDYTLGQALPILQHG